MTDQNDDIPPLPHIKENPQPINLGEQLEAVAGRLAEASVELRGAAERSRHLEQIVRFREPALDKIKQDVTDLKRKQHEADEEKANERAEDRSEQAQDPRPPDASGHQRSDKGGGSD